MAFALRWAEAQDESAIKALVRAANLNPLGIHWQQFLVAQDDAPGGPRVVGIGQIKVHGDRSRELASIATVPDRRGEGIATAVIVALLAANDSLSTSPLYLICRNYMGPFYERFGFRSLRRLAEMPPYFRRLVLFFGPLYVFGNQLGISSGALLMVRERG